MSNYNLDKCRTSHDITAYLAHMGATQVHQSGSHAKWRAPNGGSVIIPCHNGDIPVGTLHSIIKMIKLIGLGLLLFPCAILLIVANWH